jgi:hypothetical protein
MTNHEIIKAKNPLLLITRLNYELHDDPHEERTLSYIHECHNYRSIILSTYCFKSFTPILDKISYQNLHDLLL